MVAARASGSSPLARGLQQGGHQVAGGGGIIPARAGFTSTPATTSRSWRDHPRSRGVYLYARDDVTVLAGSSPLARGLPHHPGRRLPVPRIIPARAGFTPRGRRVLGRRGDHPRSRGVYQATAPRTLARSGSSPLARGLQVPDVVDGQLHGIIPARAGFTYEFCAASAPGRIIPARAGFTSPRGRPACRVRDHPRSRGIYSTSQAPTTSCRGSSPLARGLRDGQVGVEGVRGIIPARAGFTGDGVSVVSQTGDHPRSRGVYSKSNSPPGRTPGSSPLARGLPGYGPAWERELRIIPARAGFTRIACGPRRRAPDHPRSRGVYASIDAEIVARIGSSPLARGLPATGDRVRLARRIIPARAGFTGSAIRFLSFR